MRKYLAAIALALGMLAPAAHADPIGPTCTNGSCWGGIYQLVGQQVGSDPQHWLFGIIMDLSNNTLPVGTTIDAVGFKVTSSTDNILSALFLGTNANGTWGPLNIGGMSNNGCEPGNQAFICVSNTGTPQLADTNTLLGFVFDVTLKPGEEWKFLTASLKIDFSGNGHLLSEPITVQPGTPVINPTCIGDACPNAVPEPGTLLLLGAGLAGLGLVRRRRKKFDWDSWMP